MSRTKWGNQLEHISPVVLTHFLDEHDPIVLEFSQSDALARLGDHHECQLNPQPTISNMR